LEVLGWERRGKGFPGREKVSRAYRTGGSLPTPRKRGIPLSIRKGAKEKKALMPTQTQKERASCDREECNFFEEKICY